MLAIAALALGILVAWAALRGKPGLVRVPGARRVLPLVLVAALLLASCVVVPAHRRRAIVVVPRLPRVVVVDPGNYYYQGGYYYHYRAGVWYYSGSRGGPWVELPRDRYPDEVRYRRGGEGGQRDEGRGYEDRGPAGGPGGDERGYDEPAR